MRHLEKINKESSECKSVRFSALTPCMTIMTLKFLKLENKDGVAKVTLNRPEVHNAFNDDVIDEIVNLFNELSKDNSVRVIVLRAEGKSFCAGADLNWMKSMLTFSKEENRKDTEKLADLFSTIDNCPKPVIGRINGLAYGGGVGLTSVCDLVVALDSVNFCLSEVKLGLIPAVIAPFLINRIGAGNARRYFLTAERFNAAEAYKIGLVSEIAKNETEMDAVIEKWLEILKANGPEAMGESKKLIREVNSLMNSKGIDAAISYSIDAIAERRTSNEGQEGMKAFLEKRKPHWIK